MIIITIEQKNEDGGSEIYRKYNEGFFAEGNEEKIGEMVLDMVNQVRDKEVNF